MKPLSEKQLRVLLETSYDDLKRVFPDYPRRFLIAEKERARAAFPAELRIEMEATKLKEQARQRETDRLYRAAMLENEKLRKQVDLANSFPAIQAKDVSIKGKSTEREATALALASDWHCEEEVTSESTNGMNEYNLEIFDARARYYFRNLRKLLEKEAESISIKHLVIGVLGDMISGNIHADLAESNLLGPMDAIALFQDTFAAGVNQLLKETPKDLRITLICKPGNHSRITKEQRVQTEHENALEWLAYHNLAREFSSNPRVAVIRDRALLTYLDVYGFTTRWLHGHAINYGGGVGGITIPVNKAIAEWDKGKQADLTLFGHFHQYLPGPRFICNGSLIGYAPYSAWVKAAPERPQQAFCLIDSKYGRTMQAPILLEEV
jgi:hypothetical protein